MASPWDACRLAAGHVFDLVAGEDFILMPQDVPTPASGIPDGNARRATSGSAGAIRFRGIWFDAGESLHAHGRSMADSTTRPIAAETPVIEYAVEDLPEWSQEGDLVRRTKTGVTYRITLDAEADDGRRSMRVVARTENAKTRR